MFIYSTFSHFKCNNSIYTQLLKNPASYPEKHSQTWIFLILPYVIGLTLNVPVRQLQREQGHCKDTP